MDTCGFCLQLLTALLACQTGFSWKLSRRNTKMILKNNRLCAELNENVFVKIHNNFVKFILCAISWRNDFCCVLLADKLCTLIFVQLLLKIIGKNRRYPNLVFFFHHCLHSIKFFL